MTTEKNEIINKEINRLSTAQQQMVDAIRKHFEIIRNLNSDMQKATRQIIIYP